MSEFFSILLKVLYFLLVFGIIISLAYFATRMMGKRVPGGTGKYMRIVDTLYMGTERALVIVRVKDEYLLMSSSGRGIEIIKKLEDFEEAPSHSESTFEGYLNSYRRQKSLKPGILKLLHKQTRDRDETDNE
jgi:flagellar biosynthetic protein FliO